MSNVGDFSWSWILKGLYMFKWRRENLAWYIHVLHETSHWEVLRRSRAVDVKEMY